VSRKLFLAGNWKLNKTIPEAIELVNGLKRELDGIEEVDILVCPVFTALSEVADALSESNIKLGAQDLHWEETGAFTGEVSATMLKDAGCQYVIIGHSERRQYFGETNETVNKKLKAALAGGLLPIMCCGEIKEERETNKTEEVVKDHVVNGLKGISAEDVLKITIAYEPVWAIGTGLTATPEQAQEVHKFIRGLLKELYNEDTAQAVRIQYGGSMKPENVKDLVSQPDIDGGLIGGASLKVDSFSQIVKNSLGGDK